MKKQQTAALAMIASLALSACSTTGGSILPEGQDAVPPGTAVIAFSVQVTDGTTFDNCSVFAGSSAATAAWFAWPVQGDAVAAIALEVEPGNYGFHRFGCMFRGFAESTSVSGPQITAAAGDVVYLGRLIVSDTVMGTAAGHSRMPTSVRLTFEDRRDEDFELLRRKWPLFAAATPDVQVPPGWGAASRYPLRPYRDGVKVVAAPVF